MNEFSVAALARRGGASGAAWARTWISTGSLMKKTHNIWMEPLFRAYAEINWQFWVSRRLSGKARKRRNMDIFRVFATQPDGMHRRPKCQVISAQALRSFFPPIIFLIVWISTGVRSAEPFALKQEPHYGRIARKFAQYFPREHLSRAPIDDTISSRAWTNYLSSLDYNHVYFLESDITGFRAHILDLDDKLKRGDLSFAYDVFEIFKARLANRREYVDTLLKKGFDLKKKETYRWRRSDSPWPRNEEEWNEVWRRKIKNEYVQRVVMKELKKDASQLHPEQTEAKAGAPETETQVVPSPEEFINKRFKNILTVLNDSDSEWVLQKYLSAFARAYDPHSDYMSPSSVEDFYIEMKLSLIGIGALLRSEDGAAKIMRIIPGGPADRDKRKKRLRPGDKIIAVGQGAGEPEDIMHWPLHKIVKKIRGKKGTKVVLTLIPASDPTGSTTKQVDLIRDEVKLEEQAAKSRMKKTVGSDGITRNLGVIKLPSFYASMKDPKYRSSANDVEKIIDEMNRKNTEGIILDLRNNGGGSLREAVRLTGLFIESGPTVQVKEKRRTVLNDDDPRIAYSGPLVVLVNRLSASASEIVAGALQDYGRAIIVGDSKTHGKGTVQSIIEMGYNARLGAIKVTCSSYYRISGSATQLRGISSDIVVSSPFDFMELGEDFLSNPIECSPISEANYSPVADLSSIISLLNEKSEKRRAEDPRFAAYRKLLHQIDVISKTNELPLDLETRKKLAETERELSDLQDELVLPNESDDDNETDGNRDLVLDEGLKILADLVTYREKEPAPDLRRTEPSKRNLAQMITEWLNSFN